MRVSIGWLREFVDFECTPAELAEMLTMAGAEVSAVEKVGEVFDGIIVGNITRLDPHPTTERLVVCQVAVGGETLLPTASLRRWVWIEAGRRPSSSLPPRLT